MDDTARQDVPLRTGTVGAGTRHRLPRFDRWVLILAVGVGLYALLGFFAVPWLVRSQLPEAVAERTGGTASLGEVRFDPFAFVLDLRDVELRLGSEPPVLGFADLRVDLGVWESLKGVLEFDAITLAEPFVRVALDREGRLNLAEAFPRKGEAATAPPFHIDRLTIERGRLAFEDLSRAAPFRRTLSPIGLELSNFAVRAAENPASYRLDAALGAGQTLALGGTVSLEPFRAEGQVKIAHLDVRTLREYALARAGFAVPAGTVDLAARYRIGGEPARLVVREGTLDVKQLRLADRESGRVLVEIPAARVEGVEADTGPHRVVVGSMSSADGRVETWLTPEGRVNLADWLPKADPASGDTPKPEQAEKAAWSVRVDRATLDGYTVAFEDRRVSEPVKLTLAPLHLELKDYATDGGPPVRVALNGGTGGSGTLDADGTVGPDARSAELAVDLDGLDLPRFQPYLNRFARLALVKGTLDVHGRVSFRREGSELPVLGYRGDARLAGVEARLPGQDQPLASWDELAFSGLDFQSEPARLHVADIAANNLYAQIVVRPDRTLNLAQALIDSKPEKPRDEAGGQPRPSSNKPGGKPPVPVAVDVIRLENSRTDFTDQSIQPHFSTGIQNLHGTLRGVNSKPGQSAELRLEGQVDPYAPVRIEGRLNLFRPAQFADIHMRFANVDMTTLSPYSGKFAGYRIRMGKMSLDLDYRLKNRRLDSTNHIVLNRLELGEPVPGSKAPDLPLHLAIALLKDAQGRIDLDLPVRGNLNDPRVSLPGLLGKVLRGAIRKVVAAPFSLLAGLAGAGEEELRYVGFNPGEAELGTEQAAQLSKLGKALRERPALYLQVTGVAGPERDREALAEQDLIDRLKIAKLMEEGRPVDAASVRATLLSRSEYERYLARLYHRETGGDADTSIEAMKRALREPGAVTRTRLRVLAQERTAAIRDYLVRSEGLKPERIFIGEVRVERGEGPRVRSELEVRGS
jgi:hypothetical protein